MSYYMGDYYRGDFYRRGDPGFLSFLGGALKTVGGFIPGVGPLISGVGSAISAKAAAGAAASAAGAALTKPGFYQGATRVYGSLKSTALKHPVLTGAGAAGIIGAAAGAIGGRASAGGDRKCKHLLPSGKCRRRMRATNTKALRRALRRAYAFERIAMKTIHLVHPRKRGRFGGFKKPRRRSA